MVYQSVIVIFMKTNVQKIEEWIAINAPLSREALCYKTGIGFYTLKRILREERPATKSELVLISTITGLSFDDLVLDDVKSIA